MNVLQIPFAEGEARLDWIELAQAIADGHQRPRAQIEDTFLYRGKDTLLSRSAWVDGLGIAVKSTTIFPDNAQIGRPVIDGSVSVYDDADGRLAALIDFFLVTKWKTAGDSLLGALRLANPDSRNIVIVGAGPVASSLCEAFTAGFPRARISLWNRTSAKAEALARKLGYVDVAYDLADAVSRADIIATATMSTQPVIRGEWLHPGQHLNLVGAYRPDMREADDTVLQRASIYMDSFDSTVDHIGEIRIPIVEGTISHDDLIADYYALDKFSPNPSAITVFKNGGGAHLDLMTSRYIIDKFQA
ncbi:ornithine cyclodeaminase [Ruegeria sp. ANG-R]|uniref:ornithine cyclodeaminase family protein n=1 Tax=Ruegeria sp. ANG-R TaxID=1577903 RepID=UPI00057CFFC7|nr:NAD(P)-binding domain-containing protein [Ruegeria sp. ANG-R]KIC40543.1 ornithine cyclodeaminase [Ruegeria sp. ANG-R]